MDKNGMSRRERKKLETKAGILRAARHLFEDRGFDNVSIEEITERADVSKGTFFNHFSSKDSLLAGIVEEEVEDILFYAEEELKGVSGAVKRIGLVMERLVQDSVPYLKLTGRVMFVSVGGDSKYPLYRIYELLKALAEEGQKSGEITKRFDAGDIVAAILGSYYGIVLKGYEPGRRPGRDAEFEGFMNILLQGIRGAD